jgi:hypothetical protein
LIEQSKKLQTLAASLQTWRASKYGRLIRFCDHGTLTRVAAVWSFYAAAATDRQSWMKTTFKAALDARKERTSDALLFTGVRSATPTSMSAAKHVGELQEHFWKHASLHMDSTALSQTTLANPMFISPDATQKLHYGTDPLLGFHLATAYVPIAPDSPSSPEKTRLEDVVAAAKAEFRTWSISFGAQLGDEEPLTLRFFAGDAFPFCHTLQHRRVTGSARTAFWYRSRHNTMDPLVLLEDDYGVGGTAPVSFNVIDTSNLLEYMCALNVLAATSPLLSSDPSSTLYTETWVKEGKALSQDRLNDLVGGHLASLSFLLGLFPVEYWTNSSPSSSGDEHFLGSATTKQEINIYSRTTWKRPPSTAGLGLELLHIGEDDLASILYKVYVDMFPSENLSRMVANANLRSLQDMSLPTYTRASFASFLSLIKRRILTDWERAMDSLLPRIQSSVELTNGTNYMQELYLYMHLLDVHSMDTFKDFANFRASMGIEPKGGGGLAGWQDMPPSVCITLKVPRSALREFTTPHPKNVGTIPVQAAVQASPGSASSWQNLFAAVQLCFGTLSTAGSRFSNSFEVSIKEDAAGWHGDCPLYVSFRVPSWTLLLEPQTSIVNFCMQSNPITTSKFISRLGLGLTRVGHIHEDT